MANSKAIRPAVLAGRRSADRTALLALRFGFSALLLLLLLTALLCLKERKVLAVAFLLQFLHRNEAKGGGIDAVTLPGRGGSIVENVAEMRIACFPANFGALHSVRSIMLFGHVL